MKYSIEVSVTQEVTTAAADKLALPLVDLFAEFIKKLREQGHTVHDASLRESTR